MDHERFEKEVLIPLRKYGTCTFQRYDCSLQRLNEEVSINAQSVIIVEGSYSLHPCLYSYYDLKIFLDIDKKKAIATIKQTRGGKSIETYDKLKAIDMLVKYMKLFDNEGEERVTPSLKIVVTDNSNLEKVLYEEEE